MRALLAKGDGDWAVVKKLVDTGLLTETAYEGRKYYLRRFGKGEKEKKDGKL